MTPEQEEQLKKMVQEGELSAEQIGQKMNPTMTRNQVIGIVTRRKKKWGFGLRARKGGGHTKASRAKPDVVPRVPSALSANRPKTRKSVNETTGRPAFKPLVPPAEPVALDKYSPKIPRAIPMMKLEKDNCRWPINDRELVEGRVGILIPDPNVEFLFCGHKVDEGSSYCPAHRLMARGNGTPSERRAVRGLEKVK